MDQYPGFFSQHFFEDLPQIPVEIWICRPVGREQKIDFVSIFDKPRACRDDEFHPRLLSDSALDGPVDGIGNRTDKYPLQVRRVEEYGILDRSISAFTPPGLVPPDPQRAARQFVDSIEQKLAVTQRKDIYIYVHGYKVTFDNPLLVATELWHFLGYDGVMIAFSWPSTPSTLAYFADLETAALSALNLRLLLEFLASETPAHRIHIIGYSAGTRLVLDALAQLAFIHTNEDPAHIRRQCRIGKVILVGSDIDPYTGFWKRLGIGLLRLLPIESQL
jgi:hypothetical protein